MAAGATVSAVILLLGVTGLIDRLNRAVPRSVVRGLQMALGLSLLMKAMQMEFRVEDAKLLEGIKPGDEVKGELVKEDSGPVITRLQKTVREP